MYANVTRLRDKTAGAMVVIGIGDEVRVTRHFTEKEWNAPQTVGV